jgi:hypothetical protein
MTNYVVSFFVGWRTFAYGLATRLIGLPLALLMAMLLFHFVERRFARGLVSAEHFWPTSYLTEKRRLRAAVPVAAGSRPEPICGRRLP